jgi:cytoskeletal protein CcmA (bactofilin family)
MIRMGRGSKNDTPDTTPVQNYNTPTTTSTPTYSYQSESVAAPSRAVTDSESMARDIKEGRLSGFVGHGTTLTGETNFQAMLRVDGHLLGTVSSESGTLLVGTNGQVDANVAVSAAIVNGQVNGDIVATERIQLGRTARVIGNIQTPRLILEDGAILEGSCSMLKAKEAADSRTSHSDNSYQRNEYVSTSSVDDDADETESLYSSSTTDTEDEEEKADAAAVV